MSNLIVTIIAIALAAAAALTAAYYGATSWNKGQVRAKAVSLINQKEQIKTASNLYKSNTGTPPSTISDLTTASPKEYLKLNDPNANWKMSSEGIIYSQIAETEDTALDVCEKAYYELHKAPMPAIQPCSAVEEDAVCCYEGS